MSWKRCALLMVVGTLIAGCNAPAAIPTPPLGPQTWIDAPLDGSALPLVPYPVVAHASHPDGVESLELFVDGASIAVVPPAPGEEGQTLAHASWMWEIPAPGTYHLEVRSVSRTGASGPSAFARVTVPGETTATATPTPIPSATPTPAVPTLAFGAPSFSTGLFYYGTSSCNPRQVQVDVMWMDPGSSPNVVLFYRLAEADGSGRTEWNAEAMNPVGGGLYRRSLDGSAIPGHDDFSASLLQVQFVASNGQGDEVGRSDVASGPGLARCGFTLPPFFLITPTATEELPA
jgi:hypothetical protein